MLIMYILLWAYGINPSSLGSDYSSILSVNPVFLIIIAIIYISIIFFMVWMYSSLIYNAIYRKKSMGLKESLTGGKKYFSRFFGLNLLVGLVVTIPIMVLLIINYIIFSSAGSISTIINFVFVALIIAYSIYLIKLLVNWAFSGFFLIGENKKIKESLNESKKLVRGQWWKTFSYILLFLVLSWIISGALSLIAMLINLIIKLQYFSLNSATIMIATSAVLLVFGFLSAVIIYPLGVLFFKNFYLSRKAN